MYPLSVWKRLWFCLEAVVTLHLNTPGHWTFTNTEQGKKNLESEVSFCMVGQVSTVPQNQSLTDEGHE